MSTNHDVAIVTGGAQGIGLAIAARLVNRGMATAILDLDANAAQRAADSLSTAGQTLAVACDVGDADQVASAVEVVQDRLGVPSILVSNAGWSPYRRFVDLNQEEIEQIVAVNYTGPLALCRAVLEGMTEREFGRIVFIGSDAGRVGTNNETVYAGTKAALLGFAKSLALEVARYGVAVNVVSPGSTDTALLREMAGEDGIAKRIRANPMRRLGTAEDVAAAVAFFCSDDAGYITGQVLSVNGGMSRLG